MLDIKDIFLNLQFNSYEDLFKYMNNIFLDRNYVHDTYLEALFEREKKYPTGLNFGNFAIAIPHTKIEHVKEQKLIFVRLNNSVKYNEMGENDKLLDVKIFIFLLIKDAKNQVDTLVELMKKFENEENYFKLIELNDEEEIVKILNI